jgi:hypothetical protein
MAAIAAASAGSASGATPPLLFAAQVHLDAALQRGFVCGTLLVQALGDAQPVHGVYPVEVRGHGCGLVRLQAAHEMPGDRQIRE